MFGRAKLFKIKDLVFDEEIYPRMEVNWITAYSYAQAMRTGSIFPPIVVGIFDGKQYVVDGFHRAEAKKMNKEEYIEGEIKKFNSKKEMFIEAVRLNAKHGRPLSSQEKVRIIDILKKYGVQREEISALITIPMDKLEKFEIRTVRNALTGETSYLKKPFEAVFKNNPNAFDDINIDDVQGIFNVRTQLNLLSQVIVLLKNDLMNFKNKEIMKKAEELANLLFKLVTPKKK
jgi:23S rRNA maturation-related 3'-5' exoribonuclease YhaM